MTTPTSTAGNPRNRQRGFVYAVALVAVTVIAVGAQTAVVSNRRDVVADREAELLFRGLAYRDAIRAYAKANGDYPRQLSDLLIDPREPGRRFLRRLYRDPMRADGQWNLLYGASGAIVGVASKSESAPLKKAGFPAGLETFSGAAAYRDWIFDARAAEAARKPQVSKVL